MLLRAFYMKGRGAFPPERKSFGGYVDNPGNRICPRAMTLPGRSKGLIFVYTNIMVNIK
jgi:hypothetical protein